MYTVEIIRKGHTQKAHFNFEWQAAQYAEMFLDKDPVLKDPSGRIIPLYAKYSEDEY